MVFRAKDKKRDRSAITGFEILESACERNLPLEVFRSSGLGAPPSARGRLIRIEANTVIMEEARNSEGEVELRRNQQIDCFFSHRDEMYGFRTTVAEAGFSASLNGKTRVQALALRLPDRVEVTQRRARFRVSLASLEPRIPVRILFEDVIPVTGGRWMKFELIDGSGLGIGAITKSRLETKELPNRTCYIKLQTPGTEEPVVVRGQVRRAFEIESADSVRLGIQFQPWPSKSELEESLEAFEEFLMTIQRARMNKGVA